MAYSPKQARQWVCSQLSAVAIGELVESWSKNSNVKSLVWSDSSLYIELNLKKTVSYLTSQYAVLTGKVVATKSLEDCIAQSDIKGRMGSFAERMKRPPPQSPLKRSLIEVCTYIQVHGRNPEPKTAEEMAERLFHKSSFRSIQQMAMNEYRRKHPIPPPYNFKPSPWQQMALALALEQNNRKVLWIMDYDGSRERATLWNMLQHEHNFQYLGQWNPLQDVGAIKATADGYVFDVQRSDASGELYDLLQNLKDGNIPDRPWGPYERLLRSNKVVVLANHFPNVAALSLDRWQIFHTRLGLISIKCQQIEDRYYCTVANKINFKGGHVIGVSAGDTDKRDGDLFDEYIQLHSDRSRLPILFKNCLAFPKITADHWQRIDSLLSAGQLQEVGNYLRNNGLLEDSIVPVDFLDQFEQ